MTAVLERTTRSGRTLASMRLTVHRLAVPRRLHGPVQHRIAGLAHPVPQRSAQVSFHIAHRLAAGQVALFEGISLEVVELDHAWAICRVARGVGAKDRGDLDVRRNLDCESRLGVANERVPVGWRAPSRAVEVEQDVLW